MGSTKVNSGVITAEALSKAAAEMEAILARLDDSDYEDALTIKSGDDSEPLGQNLFSDPEGSATDSDSTDTTPESKNPDLNLIVPRAARFSSATPTNQTTASSDGSTNSLPSTDTKPQNNYLLFPTPVPVSPSEPRTVQIGTLNNIPIYHYYSHAEQFLSSQEYATPFGKRFLLDEPDSLLPPEDPSDTVYHPRANSGEWWPGPGNANRHFRFKKYFEIRQSKLGGLGAYATADIEGGRVILAERPLLLTTHGKVSDDVMRMGEAARGIYKSLDGGGEVGWVRRVKDRNCFDLGGGIGFFGIASRFNHACRGAANVSYNYDHCRKVMVLSTRRDIEAGTELVIDYGAGSSACLYAMYGFVCRCSGGCRPLTRKDLVAMGAGLEDCARWGLASEKELGW